MTDKLRDAAQQALESHGCERLKDFYECGPVQRAAVETFLEAALAQQDVQAVPNYDKTEMNHFAQRLYDRRMQEGRHGHYESMFYVIHKCIDRVCSPKQDLMWSTVAMQERHDDRVENIVTTLERVKQEKLAAINAAPTPPAQRVMLTASELLNMTPESIPAEHDGALLEYARAVIEAYERKNGKETS